MPLIDVQFYGSQSLPDFYRQQTGYENEEDVIVAVKVFQDQGSTTYECETVGTSKQDLETYMKAIKK